MLSTEQKSTQLYKHFLNVSDTRDNRDFYEEAIQSSFCIRPDQLLKYGDKIPRGESEENEKSIRNLKDGETFNFAVDENESVPIIKFYKDYKLKKIDNGTDNAFKLTDDLDQPIKNIIPFNYYKDLYNYDLRTNKENGSKKIYFGVGDWVLDVFSGVLKFYGDVPNGVDHNNPPTISFYQYVGGTGFRTDTIGYEGIILPVKDWFISKGSYILNEKNGETTLEEHISKAADIIQTNYTDVYGFDGNDTNEGVAYSLETITALTYTASRDAVKGYDESSDSDIGVLLSNTTASIVSNLAKITFCSQNIAYTNNSISHLLKVSDGAVTFDDGKAITASDITKVTDNKGNFIVVEGANKLADGDYVVTVNKGTSSGIMLYWNKTDHDYLPYISNEDNNFNFGVPVVAAVGRIPPSVSIGAISLNDYNDTITPDYYGPRNYTVTIGLQDESNTKSSDYVVKNYQSFYLDDILARVVKDFSDNNNKLDFKGTIFLRAGTYKLDGEKLDLSLFKNLVFKGEDKNSTIIEGNIFVNSKENGSIILNDLTVNDIYIEADNLSVTTNEVNANNIKLVKGDNLAFVKNTSANDLTILDSTNRTENNSDVLGNVWNHIEGSIIGTSKALTGHTFYNGDTIATLTLAEVNMDLVKSCFIQKVISKPSQTNIIGSTVFTYEDTAFSEIPHMKHFPIYSKESERCLEYATFSNPIEIKYDKENGNVISLKYDEANFYVDEEKGLCCNVYADQINVDISKFIRNKNYTGPQPVDALPNKNVQEALEDLYGTKADLNPNGKIPLEELPDSVAYGGLLYVGTWSFEYEDKENGKAEENYLVDGGAYPTYKDAQKNLTTDQTQDDNSGENKLQPGWFWIVASSQKNVDLPATIQKAALQDGEEEPLEFTAGDWVIWNGKNFEKLDRAYQDVAYMVLPIYTPGEHLHWSWELGDKDGTKWGLGTLELGGVTIAEGFDMINQELKKLQVQHPNVLGNIELVPFKDDYKTIDYYEIISNNISLTLTSAYDLLKDADVESFRVKTPKTDTPWKSAIYVGEETTFNAVVDNVAKEIVYHPTSELLVDGVHFEPAFDPYADEMIGRGYWTATYVDFGGENFKEGRHSFMLGITDITPKDKFNAISYTPEFAIKTVRKLDYTIDACKAALESLVTINGADVIDAENKGYCSGIPLINTDFDVNLNFTISNAIDCVGINREFLKIGNDITDYELNVEEGNITILNGTEEGLYNLKVNDLKYPLPQDKVVMNRNLLIKVLDVYGNVKELDNKLTELKFIQMPGLSEKERVCSGNGLFPSYTPSIEDACGNIYKSFKSLKDENTSELMKTARNLGDEIVYEYTWPNGEYNSYEKVIDYTDVVNGDEIDTETYRWATITKSWNGEEFENVILDETTGFTLDINVSSDVEDLFVTDEYTMTTNLGELIIMGKVVSTDVDGTITESEWFDCNSPFNGYAEIGTVNGQGAMYAGTSTKLSKRITFGTKVYSGNLILRMGLKKGSNLKVQGFTVKDLI